MTVVTVFVIESTGNSSLSRYGAATLPCPHWTPAPGQNLLLFPVSRTLLAGGRRELSTGLRPFTGTGGSRAVKRSRVVPDGRRR